MAVNREIIEVVVKGTKKSKKQLGGVNSSLSNMAKKAGIAAGAYFGARGLIEGFKQLSQQGSKLKSTESAFENMSKKAGLTTNAINKFRKATNNTVSDIDLMTKANNAMALGLVDSDDQFAELLDTAQRLGAALGQDVLSSLDSLVTGMGRQSKLMLDNLGIMVDANTAYENYADKIGTTVDKLDDLEKKTAFNEEAMRQAKQIVSDMGAEQITTQMAADELSASFTNMSGELGKALGPSLTSVIQLLTSATTSIGNFFLELTETDLETTLRKMEELGMVGEGFLALSNQALRSELKEIGGQLNLNKTQYKDIDSINKRIVELTSGQEKKSQQEINNFLSEKSDKYIRLLSLEQAELDLKNGVAEIDKETGDVIIRSIRDGQIKGQLSKQELETKNLQLQTTLEQLKKEEGTLEIVAERNVEQAEGNMEEIEFLNSQLQLLYQQKQINEEIANNKKEMSELDEGEQGSSPEEVNTLTEAQMLFNEQQLQTLETQKTLIEQQEKFAALYPEQAKKLGILTKEEKAANEERQRKFDAGKKWLVISEAIAKASSADAKIQQGIATGKAIMFTAEAVAEAMPNWGAVAAAIATGAAQVKTIKAQKFATGGDFVTDGPQMIMVGDNPSGQERVQVTPLGGDPNINGPQGGNVTLNISGNVLSEEFTEDVIIPQIKEGLRLGGDIGIN